MGADATLSVEARFKDFASGGVDAVAARAINANDRVQESVKRQGLEFGRSESAIKKSVGAMNQMTNALGPMNSGFGESSKVVTGAFTAMNLFTSGLGVAGIAIAATTFGLSALIEKMDKMATAGKDPAIFKSADKLKQVKVLFEQYIDAAARGSVFELSGLDDKMKDLGMSVESVRRIGGLEGLERSIAAAEKTTKKFDSALVQAAESRARLSSANNVLESMKIEHTEENKQLSGNVSEQARVEKAHATELANTKKKIVVDFEREIAAQAIDARLGAMQDGEAKELQALKVSNVKMVVQAMKNGVERGEAENRVLALSKEQAAAIHEKWEKKRKEFTDKAEDEAAKTRINLMDDSFLAENRDFDRKMALLQIEYDNEVENAEKIGADTTAIEQKYADARIQISREENQRKVQESVQYLEASNGLLTAGISFASAINDVEAKRDKKRTEEKIKSVDQAEKLGIMTKAEAEQRKRKITEEADKRERDRARKAKNYAIAEAIANTAVGFTKALAQGGILGIITGGAVALSGAAQLAKIEAQEFATGGFPEGANALVRVNERGQEAILNAGAVSRLGRDAIDDLNRGGTFNTNNTNVNRSENKYAPVSNIHVTQDNADYIIQALEKQPEVFFRWLEEKEKKGYGKK